MIKAILFDADGVTIKQHPYFSEVFAKEHNISLEKVTPFFKNHLVAIQTGKADLKTELAPYLKDWGVDISVEEYLRQWFEYEGVSNEEVIQFVDDLRAKGVKCYLVTDQDKYRAEYIDNVMGFKDHFDGLFYSCDLGYRKSEPEFFKYIVNKLQIVPQEIMYWDDDPKNVEVAKTTSIDGRVYENIPELKKQISI